MNLYRPKYRDRKTGELHETPRWYIDFHDHHGTRQRFKCDIDEDTTKESGRMIVDLVKCRKRKVQPRDKLWNWLMELPADAQERLVKLYLADQEWFPALYKPERIEDHILAFEQWLMTSKSRNGFHRNKKHVQNTLSRIRAIMIGCLFEDWEDITPAAVESFLGGLQIGAKTYNAYLTAVKFFCKWAVQNSRSKFSPIQFMVRLNSPNEEKRRGLTADEVSRLLEATVKAPERYGMAGLDRGILYRVGLETGYRAGELRNLTAGCFDTKKATVKLDARFCKDRQDALQLITLALAKQLEGYLRGRADDEPAFALGQWTRTAEMIQEDAIEAGIAIKDRSGLEIVFHSLRHTLRTELVRARIAEPIIDRILRHKPQGIGQRLYTHVAPFEIRAAIEKLPAYPWPGDLQLEKRKVE